ncbi:hypothetical protein [Subtercola sp. RTI3]|nr:hypothetical protein [Subtercola sp. RTI3]MEA9983743.1 hypothetical protein [Subtercola sp. RTI3]
MKSEVKSPRFSLVRAVAGCPGLESKPSAEAHAWTSAGFASVC